MDVLDYVQERWDKLNPQERKNVLSKLFPDMNEEAREEISQLQFDNLPSKHVSTWKDISGTLIMAVTEKGFSDSEEARIRDALAP